MHVRIDSYTHHSKMSAVQPMMIMYPHGRNILWNKDEVETLPRRSDHSQSQCLSRAPVLDKVNDRENEEDDGERDGQRLAWGVFVESFHGAAI